MANPSILEQELNRLKNLRNQIPRSALSKIMDPEPVENKPKDWIFEGDVTDLDIPSLIESLKQPPEEINYGTDRSIYELNNLVKQYGDYLYEQKYNIV